MRRDQFIQADKFEFGWAEANHEFEVGRPNSQKRRMSVACNYSSLNMIAMNMCIYRQENSLRPPLGWCLIFRARNLPT